MTGKIIIKLPNGEEKDATRDFFLDDDTATKRGEHFKHGQQFEWNGVTLKVTRVLEDIEIVLEIADLAKLDKATNS